MVNKRNMLFIGLVAILVNVAVLAILFYIGLRSGGTFTEIVKILSKQIYLEFLLINFGIMLLLLILKINLKFYKPLLVVSVIMVVLNLLLLLKSFIPIFNSIFWIFYLLFLYFDEKSQLRKTA